MTVLSLPSGVQRRQLSTARGPVVASYARPRPEDDLGIAVVLITGYVGSKEDFWSLLPSIAAAGYHGWAYDQIGQYESPGPLDPAAYTIELLTDDARSVITQISAELGGNTSVHLVGHCLGGFVARCATLIEPAMVRTLTLLGCGPSLDAPTQRAGLAELDRKLEMGSLDLLWPVIKRVVPERDAALRAFWFAKLEGANPGFMHGTARAMANEPDRTAALRATEVPMLVMHGRRDKRVWPRTVFASMAEDLGAEYVVVDGAAHSPSLEQPQRTLESLLGFWARATAPRAPCHPADTDPRVRL